MIPFKSKIPVMVTGVGGGGHGEQILKSLRLADTAYEIVGSDISPYSHGLSEVDHPYVLPPANDPHYLDALLAVCKRHSIRALFHGSEPELRVMSQKRERIEAEGIFLPIQPRQVIETCMDKFKSTEFLKTSGMQVPPSKLIRCIEDAENFFDLPAVLKPSVGGGGSANIFLAQTRDELIVCAGQLLAIYDEFIAQAYIGTPEEEYTVGVLTDMNGELINSIAVKRNIMSALSNRIKVPNRTAKRELGPVLAISSGVSQGEIGPFPTVCQPCEAMALKLGATGSLNVQCRLVGKEIYVFEINPRFSGTTSLRAMVGYNEPDVLIRKHVLNETVPKRFSYDSGVILRGLSEQLVQNPNVPQGMSLIECL